MPRYVTRFGVVVETSEKAAQAIGYQPAPEEPEKKAPAKRSTSTKSAEKSE